MHLREGDWEKFRRFVELEPQLRTLYNRAQAAYDAEESEMDRMRTFRLGLRQDMNDVVGWLTPESTPAELRTSDTYDIVYSVLLNASVYGLKRTL